MRGKSRAIVKACRIYSTGITGVVERITGEFRTPTGGQLPEESFTSGKPDEPLLWKLSKNDKCCLRVRTGIESSFGQHHGLGTDPGKNTGSRDLSSTNASGFGSSGVERSTFAEVSASFSRCKATTRNRAACPEEAGDRATKSETFRECKVGCAAG